MARPQKLRAARSLTCSRDDDRCSRSPSCEPWPRLRTPRCNTCCPAQPDNCTSRGRPCSETSGQPFQSNLLQLLASVGNVCVSQVSTREAGKVKPKSKDEGGRRTDEVKTVLLSSFILPPSSLPLTVLAGRRCGRAPCRPGFRAGCRVARGWSCR